MGGMGRPAFRTASGLPTAYRLPHTAHRLPPAACCLLLPNDYRLPHTAYCQSRLPRMTGVM